MTLKFEKSYGSERQTLFCGPAGYGFAEDIFGFHKGLHPESGERLMIQVGYGLRDYWKFRDASHDLRSRVSSPELL